MKVGDYVRTKKDGIGKIMSFSYQEDDECCFIELPNRRTGIKQFNIIKSSPNIIDLIEEDDFINQIRVSEIIKKTKDSIRFMADSDYECSTELKKEKIKTIVTKEMYSSVEYRVEIN